MTLPKRPKTNYSRWNRLLARPEVVERPLEISRRGLLPLLGGVAMTPWLAGSAAAQIRVEINAGTLRPLRVAMLPIAGPPELANELGAIVKGDLESSGFFQFLNPASFVTEVNLNQVPNFGQWKPLGAELLVVSQVSDLGGRLQLDFRLWDVGIGEALAGKRLSTSSNGKRRLGHILADAIYTRLTGEGAYFDSRVAFVDETGPKNNRQKRLAIMDQDGANVTYLTRAESIALTPRFHPSEDRLAYLSIDGQSPSVYLLDLARGQQQPLVSGGEMTFAPRYSPFGNDLIFSRQQEGSASLYEMNVSSGRVRRITSANAIDTSPSYAPSGEQIVFESDREGSPQIFVVNRDGSNLRRITRGTGTYSTPVWSPKGDRIAFTRLYKGQFSIGVMRPDGTGERLLTSGFHNEGPTFSPNGRVIMFFADRGSGPKLWTVDISGRNLRQVPTPNFASDPAWSPLLR